jgi:hypothetical protein
MILQGISTQQFDYIPRDPVTFCPFWQQDQAWFSKFYWLNEATHRAARVGALMLAAKRDFRLALLGDFIDTYPGDKSIVAASAVAFGTDSEVERARVQLSCMGVVTCEPTHCL